MSADLNMKKGRIVINEMVGDNNKKFSRVSLNTIQEEFNLRLNKDIMNILDARIYSFLF
jgi:hypothetical protein